MQSERAVPWRVTLLPVLVMVAALSTAHSQSTETDPAADLPDQPYDLGLMERTGIGLMFLDVEAVDKHGRPMPGLTKEQFHCKLNYFPRKIYSVDDLCPCAPYADEGDAPGDPQRSARAIFAQKPPVWILYFDFAQLQLQGRELALREARRWVRETMQPGDQVMVAVFTSHTGFQRKTDFTDDRQRLLTLIDEIAADPEMSDPFPSRLVHRMEQCIDGDVSCYYSAKRDWTHTRRSFRALLNFITLLDEIPERKILMYFHQNATLFPGRLYSLSNLGPASIIAGIRNPMMSAAGGVTPYPDGVYGVIGEEAGQTMLDGSSSDLVPDLIRLADRVGGTATSSRTAIYSILAGYSQAWTVNVGANFADFTGGGYNLGAEDMQSVTDRAGRGCACIYRIGIRVKDRKHSKVFYARVKAAGHKLRRRYRVQYVTPLDRWVRKAQATLDDPDAATDVAVNAALVPRAVHDGRWDLTAQVAVDVNQLLRLPSGERYEGAWEVGALLAREGHDRSWEMLGISRVRTSSGSFSQATPASKTRKKNKKKGSAPQENDEAIVLHQRSFLGVPPGTYELRAFVRDREANVYGGAATEVYLPPLGGQPVLAGPVATKPETTHLRSTLPIRGSKAERQATRATMEVAGVPHDEKVQRGEMVALATLICPGTARDVRDRVDRVLFRGDQPQFEMTRADIADAGDCVSLRDAIDTSDLDSGRYTYHIELQQGPELDSISSELSFEVVQSGLPEPLEAIE